jgi:hypothetical protein
MAKEQNRVTMKPLPPLLYDWIYAFSTGLFTLHCCDARKNLTLDSLEKGTTTSRNVRNLVSKTELVYTSYRVTTTDE